MILEQHLNDLFESSLNLLSDIQPSDWTEKNRVMSSAESEFMKGPYSYQWTPYCKEIINRFSPDDTMRVMGVMKGAQIGISKGVLEPIVGYYISEHPCNILHLAGHADLADDAVDNIDMMIDGCGLRHLIKPPRVTSRKTGDTSKGKFYLGGKYTPGTVTNHKLFAQRSYLIGLIDDYDKGKQSSKESGSTFQLILQRFASAQDKSKIGFFSTPELRPSNIEEVFLLGDQRYYNVPCPCCGCMIPLRWSSAIKNTDGKEKGGITWKMDSAGKLIEESVGYICQECAGFFTDKNKYEMNLAGVWVPTAEPSQEGYYSYHISSLYAPVGMYDWKHYIRDYIRANPKEGQKEHLQKTFVNLCLGEPFEQQGESPKANDLQKNIRNYEVGAIPEKLSINDGNGKFVMLTCAADMNGTMKGNNKADIDDVRLDYEIVGWTESGASYSITHGSIGTFIPRESTIKNKIDRERWTYEFNQPLNVWDEFNKILDAKYYTENGEALAIIYTGLDCGHFTKNWAYPYIDNCNRRVFGLKGKDADKFIVPHKDMPTFHNAKERNNLYLVEVNFLKDQLAERMKLNWNENRGDVQPYGFMNFPIPSNGKYLFNTFFSHYEGEHKIVEIKEGGTPATKWEKKTSNSQNHFFDVAIYNMATRDIFMQLVLNEYGIKRGTWAEFVTLIMGVKK